MAETAVKHGASSLCLTATVIAWYTCNVLLGFSNKALLANFDFHFPIFLTFVHMQTCAFCCAVLARLPSCMLDAQIKNCKSLEQLKKIGILSSVFCLSVALGNVSLRYIPISFFQAISATTPAFTAAFAFVLQSRVENLTTYATLVPIFVGTVVASRFEPLFHLAGFAACLGGTAARALKTVLQAILLDESEAMSSLSLLAHMAPISSMILLPFVLFNEPESLQTAMSMCSNAPLFKLLLACNCTLAFCSNLMNFLITRYCGALTHQVLGNGIGVAAAITSVLAFHNPVNLIGWIGYGITMIGVVSYSEARRRHMVSLQTGAPDSKQLLLDEDQADEPEARPCLTSK